MFGSFLVFIVEVIFFVITWYSLYFYKSNIYLFVLQIWLVLFMLATERSNTRVIMDFYTQRRLSLSQVHVEL